MRDFLGDLSAAISRRVGRLGSIRRSLEAMHAGFTGRRASRPDHYLDDADALKSYLASFTVPNAARALHVLSENRIRLGPGDRALDAGAGTGAAALALAAVSDPDSEILLVDQSPPALDEATRLFGLLFPEGPRVATVRADLTGTTPGIGRGPYRVVLGGHLLNELLPRRGRDLGKALDAGRLLARNVESEGALVLLEPAQRIPSRALCRVREDLVRDGHLPVGPCTHRGACPVARSRRGDWCVTDVPWRRPDLIRDVDRIVGIDRRRLTVSYLALSRSAAPRGGRIHEVQSEPMRAGDGFVVYLCGEKGRVVAGLSRRPAPPPLRGSRVTLPESARIAGKDRSGAPLIPVGPEVFRHPR